MIVPEAFASKSFRHHEPQSPSVFPGDPPEQAPHAHLTQMPVESLLCPGTQGTGKPECAFQEWRLCFPQSPGAPVHEPCWLSVPMLQGLLLPMPDPQGWEPDMGLRPLTPGGEPQRVSDFRVCGPPTQQVWDCF